VQLLDNAERHPRRNSARVPFEVILVRARGSP
jgi:hypothetical protein